MLLDSSPVFLVSLASRQFERTDWHWWREDLCSFASTSLPLTSICRSQTMLPLKRGYLAKSSERMGFVNQLDRDYSSSRTCSSSWTSAQIASCICCLSPKRWHQLPCWFCSGLVPSHAPYSWLSDRIKTSFSGVLWHEQYLASASSSTYATVLSLFC